MADPLGIAAQLLSPAFAKVAGAPATDPVVRASDHANAQANGALDVARRLGRNPRQVAGEILAATDANRVLHRRYGWQWNLVPLIRIPGVTQVHAGLPWREKWHKARNRDVWDDSAIVRIDFSS